MVIDFHTHIYPERIAERTVEILKKNGHYQVHTNGKIDGLLQSMREADIGISVVLPVATKPSQFESITKFAIEVNQTEGLRSFGGIHPLCDSIEEKLDIIKNAGLRGIKLHPDYQNVPMDDEKTVYVARAALERGLYITFHSGFDPAYPTSDCSTAKRAYNLIDRLSKHFDFEKEPKIILAHLGSNERYDDTENVLIDLPVYFDLSNLFKKTEDAQIIRIIRKHGSQRILFATDSPWRSQKGDLAYFMSLDLTDFEKEQITSLNGKKILGIS